jgi:hypothetical protein
VRTALLALAFPLIASLAQAQVLQLEFTGSPVNLTDAGQVIGRRIAMRAWQDSVEVFAEQAAQNETGWRVTTTGSGNFLVSIVAVPVAKPGYSGVAMSVVVFQPATLVPWKYLSHFVSVVDSAEEAARSIVQTSIGLIRARR